MQCFRSRLPPKAVELLTVHTNDVAQITVPPEDNAEHVVEFGERHVIADRDQADDHRAHLAQNRSQNQAFERGCFNHLSRLIDRPTPDFLALSYPALRRDRLSWVNENYIRDETLIAANANLVSAQNQVPLAHAWGCGEVASADGMRFVVPIRTIHAGPNPKLIAAHWDDLLRLAGSLKLGRVPATGIMRTLQVADRPTRLAQALAEFGRIDKTLHSLTYIDDENRRRATLTQLNRGEGRHSLGRAVFHGKRGELRQRYREGREDQLGALGLVLNVIVLWNTIYMNAALTQLRAEGYSVRDEDVARLSPLIHEHINMLGRYSFMVPEPVVRGELRPLRTPADEEP